MLSDSTTPVVGLGKVLSILCKQDFCLFSIQYVIGPLWGLSFCSTNEAALLSNEGSDLKNKILVLLVLLRDDQTSPI